MRIPYVTRSAFLEPCRAALREHLPRLPGETVRVALDKAGGYRGVVRVAIEVHAPNDFDSDWAGPDPTPFPARIRTAATALRDAHCFGRFEISHADGSLTIARLGD